MFYPLLSIAVGSVLGGWLRWFLSLKLNLLHPYIPLGTLAVNLIGSFIIGLAIAFFAQSQLSANYKLLIITGFCGGLTTFSSFSAEVVLLLQSGKLSIAAVVVLVHVIGSLLCTFLGIFIFCSLFGTQQ